MTPLRRAARRSVWVWTTILSSAGVVQEAGVPRRPSISTRQSRHDPNASIESVAQSFGILVPSDMAAAITDVPRGTVMLAPSMVSVTLAVSCLTGVPKSISETRGMVALGLYSAASQSGGRAKSCGKCLMALSTGTGVSPPMAQSDASVISRQRSSTRAIFLA